MAAAPGRTVDDRLDVTLDGAPLASPVRQIRSRHGGRISRFDAPPGLRRITYQAVASGGSPDGEVGEEDGDEDLAQLEALRPSRYCPSDALLGFASEELDDGQAGADLARSVVGWVATLTGIEVRAIVDGVRPTDDGTALVQLPLKGRRRRQGRARTLRPARARAGAARPGPAAARARGTGRRVPAG